MTREPKSEPTRLGALSKELAAAIIPFAFWTAEIGSMPREDGTVRWGVFFELEPSLVQTGEGAEAVCAAFLEDMRHALVVMMGAKVAELLAEDIGAMKPPPKPGKKFGANQ